MKAPDKIVMPEATSQLRFTMTESVEYIRKEALMEWLEGCKNNPVITDLQKGNIQELIDKLNEM